MSKFLIRFGISAGLLLTLAFGAFAQEFRGTISGTVTDQNGAVVPAATVTIQNIATNLTATATTNEEGTYTFPLLTPGQYKLTATAANFKTALRENLELNVDDKISVDFQMEIGASADVTIVANDELIERGTVSIGTVVTNRQVEELPLAEGAPYVLATQAPGVVYTGDPNFSGPTANGNLAGFRSNGASGNQINLDGSPNLAYSGQVAFTPPSDAVQEFKVQTNTFDAQMVLPPDQPSMLQSKAAPMTFTVRRISLIATKIAPPTTFSTIAPDANAPTDNIIATDLF